MRWLYVLIVSLLELSNTWSYELPVGCVSSKGPRDCYNCKGESPKVINGNLLDDFNNTVTTPIETLSLFTEKAKALRSANSALKDYLASMFRSLRDGEKEPTYDQGMKEIGAIFEDFNQLTILSKEAIVLQKKLNICSSSCSATRKLELNDDIERVQRLKSIVLIKRPLLANHHFEKMFNEMSDQNIASDQFFSREVFENKLNSAIYENLQGVLKKEHEYGAFESDWQKPFLKFSNLDLIKSYNEDLISRFPLISESIIESISSDEALKTPPIMGACYLAQRYLAYINKLKNKELALDTALFVLPFALGPLGRASELGFKTILSKRLASYGLRANESSQKIAELTNIGFQGLLVAGNAGHIANEIQECKQKEAEFFSKANAKNLESLQNCKNEVSNSILMAELSAIPIVATNISKRVINLKNIKGPSPAGRLTLLLKDFGGGKNKVIKEEMDSILKLVKEDKKTFDAFSNIPKNKDIEIDEFLKSIKRDGHQKQHVSIAAADLEDFQKKIGKDTIELLYIPGADVPHLPKAIRRVGHVALRIGDKVYHQTGGSGFKIESFANFLSNTKKEYKVYGQVIKASEKEQKVMESYFQKVHDKQLPYSFLVNNCSQTICRSLGLADVEKINPAVRLDPFLTQLKLGRNDRVMMKTLYNADKDLSEKELLKATAANRLAFYGIPVAAATATTGAGIEAVDFMIDYLNQIQEAK